eukprot:IDg14947t1
MLGLLWQEVVHHRGRYLCLLSTGIDQGAFKMLARYVRAQVFVVLPFLYALGTTLAGLVRAVRRSSASFFPISIGEAFCRNIRKPTKSYKTSTEESTTQ